jgi:hypothetical protein
MRLLGLALGWLLLMTGVSISEEFPIPQPRIGVSSGGHYCETRTDLDGFLTLRDLVNVGELAPLEAFPPRCGQLPHGIPLFFEPLEWVEYRSAWLLVARVTTLDRLVMYVYVEVREKVEV